MGLEEIAKRGQVPAQTTGPQPVSMEARERVVVLSLELSGRTLGARSLEELYFLLTNDLRTLIEFDRSFLITHVGGESRLVAAGNQPSPEKKSKFTQELDNLAVRLKALDKALLLTKIADLEGLSDDVLAPEIKEALASYMRFAKCTGLLCVPMVSGGETLGHLLLEYLDGKIPDQIKIMAVAKLAPVFASALAQRWILNEKPRSWYLLLRSRLGREAHRAVLLAT